MMSVRKVSNPFYILQAIVIVAQVWALRPILRAVWTCHRGLKTEEEVALPFELKQLGLAAVAGAALGTAHNLLIPGQLLFAVVTALSWALIALTLLTLALAKLGFRRYARESVVKARHIASDFVRLNIYRDYAESFPGKIAPLLSQLDDPTAMRILKEMSESGYEVDGRPLKEAIQRQLESAPPETLAKAIDAGLCDEGSALMTRALQSRVDVRNDRWERILRRDPGAPMVGHMLRAMVEEALARQDATVALRYEGPRINHLKSRLVRKKLENVLSDLLKTAGLELTVLNEEDGAPSPFCIVMENIDSSFERMRGIETQRVEEVWYESRGRSRIKRSAHTTESKEVEVSYPVIRMRARILRHGRQEAQIDLDSSPGLKGLNPKHAPSQDELVKRALSYVEPVLTKGLGLHVRRAAAPATAR